MKAFTKYRYGGPEVLQIEEVEKPTITDQQILVQVQANSVNPADWHIIRGKPYFSRLSFGLLQPQYKIAGADFVGTVAQVGSGVTQFQKGDLVYGESLKGGAFATYTAVDAKVCAHVSIHEKKLEFAGLALAGVTALESLTTHGQLQQRESVLINGASGGVGHLAVQIAKAMGANVTAVCSSKSVSFVTELGADKVIPYDQINIHQHKADHDLVIDNYGNLNFNDYKRLGKRGVVVGFTNLGQMMKVLLSSLISPFSLQQFTASPTTEKLDTLAQYLQEGKIQVYLDRVYPFEQIPEAIVYIENMRTKGKVVIDHELKNKM